MAEPGVDTLIGLLREIVALLKENSRKLDELAQLMRALKSPAG